jgi:hypothetical protein
MLRPIGITGKIAAGKDTFADALVEHECKLFKKYSLASPMKKIAEDIFGFSKDQLYVHELKETTDAFWDITPRRFLQIMGTDMFRDHFRKDVWLKLAEKHMRDNPDKHIVIADIRFENEAQFIRDLGGVIIRINRPGQESNPDAEQHSSEAGLPDELIDYEVPNNSDICSLKWAVNTTWVPKLIEEAK